jgi:hypothetical protein
VAFALSRSVSSSRFGPNIREACQTQERSTQLVPAGQAVQIEPGGPQAALDIPSAQKVPAGVQQPLGQLAAVQRQAPSRQVSPNPHRTHIPPAVPHAVSLSTMQTGVPSLRRLQQPLEQPSASQTQAPFTQLKPAWHVRQIAPPAPQASSALPGRQVSSRQQPPGQVCASQAACSHRPLTHDSSAAHSSQTSPPVPQALSVSPGKQESSRQQPFGQLTLSQTQPPETQR